jgi:tetratricopeptide (TPR) repeat protein
LTGLHGRSALVALLFAIHPLHVESVAWVAERKDVLSTTFWFLVLAAYSRYAARPGLWRFAAVFVFLMLGLAAKPMLVTVPLVLVIVDYWPLRRIERDGWRAVLTDKLPLLALSAASSVITVISQRAGGAMGTIGQYPPLERLASALVAYGTYLWKTIYPAGLAVFYPYREPGEVVWQLGLAVAALLVVSIVVVHSRRRHPYLLAGWAWFLVTLIPVIGLVQVGEQAMADRYSYVPLIGVFWAVVWGAAEGLERLRRRKIARLAATTAGIAVLATLTLATHAQTGRWRDSMTLFKHALEVTQDNHTAHLNLALAYSQRGRSDEALRHVRETLRLRPDYVVAHRVLANLEFENGDHDAALVRLERALRIDADDPETHYVLGTILAHLQRWDRAIVHLSRAALLRPRHGATHYNLGAVFYFRADYARSWEEMRRAQRYGYPVPEQMLEKLRQRMPEPG